VAGNFLIIDMSQTPPAVVTATDVLPAVITDALAAIDAKLGKIMTSMADEQGQLDNMATAMQAVADHVSSATATLAQWITDHSGTPDLTHLTTALASLQTADSGLTSIVPQAPATPITPIPDPGPAPTPPVDTTTPAVPVDTPPAAPADPTAPPVDPTAPVDPGTLPVDQPPLP